MGFLRLLSAVFLAKCAIGLQFYLQEGQTLCFGDNIAPNTKVLGEYTVAAGSGHMPVDIAVVDASDNKTLYERSDINHGKFAFIAPFGNAAPKIHSAELHRKEPHEHHHEHSDHDYHHRYNEHEPHHNEHGVNNHYDEHGANHHYDEHGANHHYDEHSANHHYDEHGANHHYDEHSANRHYDEHGANQHYDEHRSNHEQPPEHEHGHDWDRHGHDEGVHHRQTRSLQSYENEHAQHRDSNEHSYHEHHAEGGVEKLDHMDAHDGAHQAMEDEWDMDKYEGVDDEELEKDWEENEKHAPHSERNYDEEMDEHESEDLYGDRKFLVCVMSRSSNNILKRRVRLVMRHGKTAHDYTRLAKAEHLSSLELTLRIVSDELKELHTELDHARKMEEALQIMNEHTNAKVVRCALLSLAVLLGVSAFQASYTKRFFKTKKLL